MPAPNAVDRRIRFSHAIYGAIIITAELVLERNHVDEALEALAALVATGAVLFLAHLYSATAARRADGTPLRPADAVELFGEELPVLAALVVPFVMLSLSALGIVDLDTAFTVSIGATVLFLFLIGFVESRHIGRGRLVSSVTGLLGAVIGVLVILLEAWIG